MASSSLVAFSHVPYQWTQHLTYRFRSKYESFWAIGSQQRHLCLARIHYLPVATASPGHGLEAFGEDSMLSRRLTVLYISKRRSGLGRCGLH